MDNLNSSLSANNQLATIPEYIVVNQKGTLYDVPVIRLKDQLTLSELPEEQEIETTEIEPITTAHPLILADRELALQTIESILSAAQEIQQQLDAIIFEGPICPYEKTLLEYLGPNFICPTVHDLALPQNFCPQESVKSLLMINKKYEDLMMTHVSIMSAEAADTSFPGITSENLGNAFSVLSATSAGEQYVIDREKTAQNLEFAELVRNLSVDDIVENPFEVAQKLVARYIEIHQ